MTTPNQSYLSCFALAAALCCMPVTVTHAASSCHYIERASFDVQRPGQARSPTVEGEINGQAVQLEIDTGTSQTYILRAEAERQNLHPERIQRQVQSNAGAESLFLVKVKNFAIGGLHAPNMRFPVIEAMGNKDVHGIVGNDFLLQYDVELNLPEHRVKLYEADHCKEKALAYWDQEALAVPLEFTSGYAQPLVQVQINGMPFKALISTSARYSTVDLDAVRRLGMSTTAPGVVYRGKATGIGEEKMERWNMTFDSFAIGEEVVQHPRLVVADTTYRYRGRKPYDMVLGRDFLGAHRVLLAQSQMQFYYSYNGGQVFLKDEMDAIALPQAAR
jgi:predicted aspartyl protease